MTSTCPTRCDRSAPNRTVRRNPIPSLKKEQWESHSTNSSSLRPPIPGLNRFPGQKNSSDSSAAGLVVSRGDSTKSRRAVTTGHLLSALARRKPLDCYGSRYRMPIFSGPITAGKRTGGEGVQLGAAAASVLPVSSHGNFAPKGDFQRAVPSSKKKRTAKATPCRAGAFP
jgi:hypothetical protein